MRQTDTHVYLFSFKDISFVLVYLAVKNNESNRVHAISILGPFKFIPSLVVTGDLVGVAKR